VESTLTSGAAVRGQRFQGKSALITGGTKGIGRAIALRLAQENARVAVTWFRDVDSAERLSAEFDAHGLRLCCLRANLQDSEAPRRVILEAQRAIGPIDLLVSNAASGVYRPLREATQRHWDWTFQTNAGCFVGLMQAARSLEAVVAMSSLGTARVQTGYGTIAASKAALESLVRYFAIELAPATRVNAISAGLVDTASIRRFPGIDAAIEHAKRTSPMQRLVAPADVANLAAFLLSDEASMITGQTVVIDGGYSIQA